MSEKYPDVGDKFLLGIGNIVEIVGTESIFGHVTDEDGSLLPVGAFPCRVTFGSESGNSVEYLCYGFEELRNMTYLERFKSGYYRRTEGKDFGEVRMFDKAPDEEGWELVNVTPVVWNADVS